MTGGTSVGQVSGRLVLFDDWSGVLVKASKGLDDFSSKMKATSAELQSVGQKMSMGLTLPIVGMGAAILKAGVDFETSFAGIVKTVDSATDEMGQLTAFGRELEQGMRNLAKQIPINVNELNALGEAAGQLGIQDEKVLGFTEVMAKMGVATTMSAENAAMSMARFANITNMSQDNFERLGSTIVQMGNNFAATETEITSMALRIAGAGKQVKMTEPEIIALATALSSVGIRAEMGGSAISKAMLAMSLAVETGNSKLEQFAQVAGYTVEEFSQQFRSNASVAVLEFIQGLSKMDDEGMNAITMLDEMGIREVRLRDTLLRSTNAVHLMGDALQMSRKEWTENSALAREVGLRFQTLESRFIVVKGRVHDLAIEIQKALKGAIVELLELMDPWLTKLEGLTKQFAELSPSLQAAIVGFAGLLAALGPIAYVTGTVIGALSGLMSVGKLLLSVPLKLRDAWMVYLEWLHSPMIGAWYGKLVTDLLQTFYKIQRVGATVMGALTTPITAVVVAIGLLTTAWVKFTGDWTRAFDILLPPIGLLRTAIDALSGGFVSFQGVANDLQRLIKAGFTLAWEEFKTQAEGVRAFVMGPMKAAWEWVRNIFAWLVDDIRKTVVPAFKFLSDNIQKLPGLSWLISTWESAKAAGRSFAAELKSIADDAEKAAEDARAGAVPDIKQSETFKKMAEEATNGITLLAGAQAEIDRALATAGQSSVVSAERAKTLTSQLAETQRMVAGLTREQRDQIIAGDRMNMTTKEITESMGKLYPQLRLTEAAVGMFVDRYEEAARKAEKFQKDVLDFGKSDQANQGPLLGIEKLTTMAGTYAQEMAYVIQKTNELTDAQRRSIDAGVAVGHTTKTIAENLQIAQEVVARYTSQMAKLWAENKKLADSNLDILKTLPKLETQAGSYQQLLEATRYEVSKLSQEQRLNISSGLAMGRSVEEIAKSLDVSVDAVRMFVEQRKGLTAIANEFARIGQIVGGMGGTVMGSIGQIVSGLDYAQKSGERTKSQFGLLGEVTMDGATKTEKFAAALAAAGAVAQGVTQILEATANTTSKVGGAMRGAMAGASAGAAFGPIGAGIGAVAGGVLGMFRASSNARKELEALRKKASEAFDTFKKGKPEIENMDAVLAAFGFTLVDVREQWHFDLLQEQLADFDRQLNQTRDRMDDLLGSAQNLGIGLPNALRESIQRMIDLGIVTGDTAEMFKDMLGEGQSDWRKMQEAAERYGISIDKLGQGFQQSRLDDTAKQIINDFDLLTRGGADANLMVRGMGDEINKLVAESMKFGTTIPENMRDMIQSLADSGQLFTQARQDANGLAQEIIDMSGSGAELDALLKKFKETGDLTMTAQQAMEKFGISAHGELGKALLELEKMQDGLGDGKGVIKDLTNMNFGERIKTEFEKVVEKLEEMVKILERIPPLLGETADAAGRMPSAFPTPEPYSYGPADNYGGYVVPGSGMDGGASSPFFDPGMSANLYIDGKQVTDVVIDRMGNRLALRGGTR